jgi:hypothetical protein
VNTPGGREGLEKQTTTWNFELLDAEDEYWKEVFDLIEQFKVL